MQKHKFNKYPEMQEKFFNNLKNDIEVNGYDKSFPIYLYEDKIIDGWNRYRACKELSAKHNKNIEPIYEEFIGNDMEVISFILRTNNRRDLMPYQRCDIAFEYEEIWKNKAKENLSKGGKISQEGLQISAKAVDTRKELAKIAKVSHDTIAKVKKINEKAPEETKEQLRTGEVSINAAYRDIKKEEKKESIKEERRILAEEGSKKEINIDFRLGDFEEVFADLKDGSIDCIITDPPYPYEFIEVWTKLSRFAKRVLKPNGFCIAYSGQMHLPEVMKRMSEHLDYYWTFAMYHEGQTQIVNGVNLICRWKPVLIFQKNKKKINNTIQDYFISEQREKQVHNWQQSVSGVSYLIEMFTKPNDLILEPFAGGGTTIIAAKEKHRNIIAAEIDHNTYNITKEVIWQQEKNLLV
jgi:DNA modification methylase